jgi:hypothetical protein
MMALPLGAAIALVDLVDCLPVTNAGDGHHPNIHRIFHAADGLWRSPVEGPASNITDQLPYGDFTPGRYGWLLDSIRPLPEPVPVKGRQGLWTPDADVVAAVDAQLAGVSR